MVVCTVLYIYCMSPRPPPLHCHLTVTHVTLKYVHTDGRDIKGVSAELYSRFLRQKASNSPTALKCCRLQANGKTLVDDGEEQKSKKKKKITFPRPFQCIL